MALLVEVVGLSFCAMSIASLTSLIVSLDATADTHSKRVAQLKMYLLSRKVSTEMQDKVMAYMDYLWSHLRGVEELTILEVSFFALLFSTIVSLCVCVFFFIIPFFYYYHCLIYYYLGFAHFLKKRCSSTSNGKYTTEFSIFQRGPPWLHFLCLQLP